MEEEEAIDEEKATMAPVFVKNPFKWAVLNRYGRDATKRIYSTLIVLATALIILSGILVAISVFVIVISLLDLKKGFYFTLLYENPNSENIGVRITHSFFMFGYLIGGSTAMLLLNLVYLKSKTRREFVIWILGNVTLYFSLGIIAIPGGYLPHSLYSTVAVLLWYIFLGANSFVLLKQHRHARFIVPIWLLPAPILLLTAISYLRAHSHGSWFWFSVFQHAMGILFFVEFLAFMWYFSVLKNHPITVST